MEALTSNWKRLVFEDALDEELTSTTQTTEKTSLHMRVRVRVRLGHLQEGSETAV